MKFFYNLNYLLIIFIASFLTLTKTANKQYQICNSKKAFCNESKDIIANETKNTQLNITILPKLQEQVSFLANKIRDLTLEYKNLIDPNDDNSTYHEPLFVESFIKESQQKSLNSGITKENLLSDLLNKSATLLSQLEKLEAENSELFSFRNKTDISFRFAWIKAQTKCLKAHLQRDLSGVKYQFDLESELLYGAKVDEKYYSKIPEIREKLKRIIYENELCFNCNKLTNNTNNSLSNTNNSNINDNHYKLSSKNSSLYEKYYEFRSKFNIPNNSYAKIFKECLDFTIGKYLNGSIDEFNKKQQKINLQFYHDVKDAAEAYAIYKGNFTSDMRCNTARQITLEKCQQLASHEGTHHFHFCLLDDLYTKYSELQSQLEYSPMSFIMEGAAEVGVDLIFSRETRKKHLAEKLIPMLNDWNLNKNSKFTEYEVEKIIEIDHLTTELWRSHTLIAKEFVDGKINYDECNLKMKEVSLKPKESWPNCDFYRKNRSYMIGYGWGKFLIMEYLKIQRGDIWDNYVEFLRRPPTPEYILKELRIHHKI